MHYTQEDYDNLKQYAEEHMRTAVYSGYKRSTTANLNKFVEEAYNRATGKDEHRNLNCSACVYNLFREAGRLYFQDKEIRDKVEKQLEPKAETPTTTPSNTDKKKKNNKKATIA